MDKEYNIYQLKDNNGTKPVGIAFVETTFNGFIYVEIVRMTRLYALLVWMFRDINDIINLIEHEIDFIITGKGHMFTLLPHEDHLVVVKLILHYYVDSDIVENKPWAQNFSLLLSLPLHYVTHIKKLYFTCLIIGLQFTFLVIFYLRKK
ncbi:hypothetical protein ACJX0J_031359 [Zea mays]